MSGFGTPRSKWNWLPTPAFIVHHPSFGPFLIDTGFHPSVASKPVENLGLMGRFARPRMEPGQDVAAQLRARKIDVSKIKLVVMTHLHFDHASAMSEFSSATFIVTEDEWEAASTVSRPLLHGYHRAQFDYAFDYRTVSYAGDEVSSYATFGRTIDLFGDGSVRLASTPGHSAGHQSVILRLADRDFVVAGDAVLHDEPARGRGRATPPGGSAQLAPLDARARPLPRRVPRRRDRPRPRPGVLADARAALRVARRVL